MCDTECMRIGILFAIMSVALLAGCANASEQPSTPSPTSNSLDSLIGSTGTAAEPTAPVEPSLFLCMPDGRCDLTSEDPLAVTLTYDTLADMANLWKSRGVILHFNIQAVDSDNSDADDTACPVPTGGENAWIWMCPSGDGGLNITNMGRVLDMGYGPVMAEVASNASQAVLNVVDSLPKSITALRQRSACLTGNFFAWKLAGNGTDFTVTQQDIDYLENAADDDMRAAFSIGVGMDEDAYTACFDLD